MDCEPDPNRTKNHLAQARLILEGSSTEQSPSLRLNNRVLPTKFRYIFSGDSEQTLRQLADQLKSEPYEAEHFSKDEENLLLLSLEREEMHTPESLAERIEALKTLAKTAGAQFQKCIPVRFQLRLGKSVPHHLKNDLPPSTDGTGHIAI